MKIHVEYVRYEVLACSVECPYANCSADSGVAPTATHTSPPNYEEDTSTGTDTRNTAPVGQ